jgi:Mg2+-importing ATPase
VVGSGGADPGDEREMTFVGFLGLSDLPKAGIAETIERLGRLGVALKVISGDNRNVAAAVASRVGLASPRMLCGDEIARLAPAALATRAAATDVFAEVEPNQKERILRALQKAGHVVGYLGDGINDAPALHTADVGISVDGAADVAKDAAAIVLLEHDLDVLVEGILVGRQTFENTMKYIRITTSANFGNMLSMAAAVPFLPFLPMLPAQILLNNFLSDLPAMTLASDRVDEEAAAAPGRWEIRDIRNFMLVFGAISSAFDLMTFGVLLLVMQAGADEFRSAWFLESLLTEIGILLVMRTRRGLFASRPSTALLVVSALVAATAVALLYVPASAGALDLVPIPLPLLATVAAITVAYVVVSERAKRWFFARAERRVAAGRSVGEESRITLR